MTDSSNIVLVAAALSCLVLGCVNSDDDKSQSASDSMSVASTGATSGDEASTGTDSAADCWQHYNREDCEAEGPPCQFEAGEGTVFEDGACTPLEDLGWCVPAPYGGAGVGSTWWEPSTGRVLALGFDPGDAHHPGWESCGWNNLNPTCDDPPTVEACRVCFCGPDEADTGTSGTDSSGTSG